MRHLLPFRFRDDRPVQVRSTRQAKAALARAAELETGSARDRAWANRCYRAVVDYLEHDPRGRRRFDRGRLLDRARTGLGRTGSARRAVVEALIRAEEVDPADLETALADTAIDLRDAIQRHGWLGGQAALTEAAGLALRAEALCEALADTYGRDVPGYDPRWPLAA